MKTQRVYTADELLHLMKVRAAGCRTYLDDIHTTERKMFETNVEKFIDWLIKMEAEGKIEHLLLVS